MLDNDSPLPTSRSLARLVIDRIDRFRSEVRRASDREIEAGAEIGRGVLRRIRKIAEGTDDGAFVYQSVVAIDGWIKRERSVASEAKETTSEFADAG